MQFRHVWSRAFPSKCSLDEIRYREDYVVFKLYCQDSMTEYSVNFINGRVNIRKEGKPEARGVVERKREFQTVICYKGYGVRAWSKIYRSLNTKASCRKDICVIASLKPNLTLELNVVSATGDTLETITFNNVFDFDVASSENIIVATTRGLTPNSTITVLIDSSTGTIIDNIAGFGGSLLASPDYLFVYGEKEGVIMTHGYDNEGEELFPGGEEGLPILYPFNPIPHRVPEAEKFESKNIVLMGKNDIKLFNPEELAFEYTFIRPPYTRGIFNVDINNYNTTALINIMGNPFMATFDFKGRIRWISHIVRDLRYAMVYGDIIAQYVFDGKKGETRLYRVKDNTLIHEETFGPNVVPVLVRKTNILLTDGRVVASYIVE